MTMWREVVREAATTKLEPNAKPIRISSVARKEESVKSGEHQ